MITIHLIRSLVAILFFAILYASCSKQQELNSPTLTNVPIHYRTVLHDSIYEQHNEFILWLFDNYSDSAFIYSSDPVDFMGFVERKIYMYNGTEADIIPLLIEDDELIFPDPYYVKNEGFTVANAIWSSVEYDSLYVVLDSVYAAFGNTASESTIQQIILRGKTRIQALTFTHEDDLVNILKQMSYSTELMFELDDDFGSTAYIDPCALAGAYADVLAHNFFSELGDLDPGDPMYSHAKIAIAGISAYSFANCYCC